MSTNQVPFSLGLPHPALEATAPPKRSSAATPPAVSHPAALSGLWASLNAIMSNFDATNLLEVAVDNAAVFFSSFLTQQSNAMNDQLTVDYGILNNWVTNGGGEGGSGTGNVNPYWGKIDPTTGKLYVDPKTGLPYTQYIIPLSKSGQGQGPSSDPGNPDYSGTVTNLQMEYQIDQTTAQNDMQQPQAELNKETQSAKDLGTVTQQGLTNASSILGIESNLAQDLSH